MTRRIALVALLLAACATPPPPPPPQPVVVTQAPRPPPPSALPSDPQIAPARLDVEHATERLRQRLARFGFPYAAPVRAERGPAPEATIARARRILARTSDSEPQCSGDTEVIQASAVPASGGTMLHVTCYTAKLEPIAAGASQCTQTPVAGCPNGGDAVVGQIILDAVGTL